jgi:hypothetical protein
MIKPYYSDENLAVWHGECLEAMALLPDASVDAVVTDPPYGLGFMGRDWDYLPPGREWAEACLRVLKPGGHLLAFGGTRTWHRLACAVEDSAPATDAVKQWAGWGTALKPAFEPIVVGRKPLAGTVAANVQAHGTGALNIDACRVPAQGRPLIVSKSEPSVSTFSDGLNGSKSAGVTDAGRWPANVVLDDTQATQLDKQSGTVPSTGTPTRPARPGALGKNVQGPLYSDTGRRVAVLPHLPLPGQGSGQGTAQGRGR